MGSSLRPVLDRWYAYTRDGMLYTGPGGRVFEYETLRNAWGRAQKQTGHQLTLKELRHFAASLWIKVGASRFLVMTAGGWSSRDMVSKVDVRLWETDIAELATNVDELDWETLT